MAAADALPQRNAPALAPQLGPHEPEELADLMAVEFHALTDPRDPPDPADVAWEQDRLARLDAAAATTRRHIAETARRLRPVAFDDYGPGRILRCVETFREWLHMPDPGALLVTLATVAANRADGDPVWLLVVGPPGSGKTEIINAIKGEPNVHVAATITEGALLSGTPRKERATGSKGGLLREIGDFGIIALKDFGSILSMNRDTRSQVLAALREIYDGEWTRHVGTDGGQTLSWCGKVALIAGATPAIDAHHAVIGSMGERFIFYRLPLVDEDVQAQRALAHVGRERQMRAALGASVRDVLDAADPALLLAAPDADAVRRLVGVSTLAVRCRSAVERDSYSHEITLIPDPEAPARLALVLLRLLNALRAIGAADGEAWALVTKCALDSMPAIRRAVLEAVILEAEPVSTTKTAERLGYPTITVRRAAEDLAAHGVLVRTVQGAGLADLWRASDWTRERWATPPTEMSVGARGDVAADDPLSTPFPPRGDFSVGGPPDALAVARSVWGDDLMEHPSEVPQ